MDKVKLDAGYITGVEVEGSTIYRGVKGLIDWTNRHSSTDKYLYVVEPLEIKSGYSKVQKQED